MKNFFENTGLGRALWGKSPRKTLLRAIILGLSLFLIFKLLLIPVRVQTEAMEPEISKGSLRFVSPIPYWFSAPKTEDIVAISLSGSSLVYISRVIGQPTQVVRILNNQLYVDDQPAYGGPLQLPDGIQQIGYESEPVGENEVFVAGDWRNGSLEEMHSQGSFGRVRKTQILGKVLF